MSESMRKRIAVQKGEPMYPPKSEELEALKKALELAQKDIKESNAELLKLREIKDNWERRWGRLKETLWIACENDHSAYLNGNIKCFDSYKAYRIIQKRMDELSKEGQ